MEPTLKIDDRVLVVKDTIVQLDIASGDIVVFYNNAGINDTIGISAGPNEFRKSLDRNLVHYYTMANLCIKEKKWRRYFGVFTNLLSIYFYINVISNQETLLW